MKQRSEHEAFEGINSFATIAMPDSPPPLPATRIAVGVFPSSSVVGWRNLATARVDVPDSLRLVLLIVRLFWL